MAKMAGIKTLFGDTLGIEARLGWGLLIINKQRQHYTSTTVTLGTEESGCCGEVAVIWAGSDGIQTVHSNLP